MREAPAKKEETVREAPAKKEEPPGALASKLADDENWATLGVSRAVGRRVRGHAA